jgi:hypothetical protein
MLQIFCHLYQLHIVYSPTEYSTAKYKVAQSTKVEIYKYFILQ